MNIPKQHYRCLGMLGYDSVNSPAAMLLRLVMIRMPDFALRRRSLPRFPAAQKRLW